ncbi:hypothetical protein LUTEI9C_100178 [Luteimonas sp. 9C]|nr:hypothetical protein LUTEI9C_100178 [Luteimonas sp. 9C]
MLPNLPRTPQVIGSRPHQTFVC